MNGRRITIKDVASAAGVGIGTIDRVMHNRGRVAEKTRHHVLKIVDKLGYKPNMAARVLAKHKVYTIAVVYHNKELDFWGDVEKGIATAGASFSSLGIQIKSYILPQVDIARQLKTLKKITAEDIDAIGLVPYCSPKISRILNETFDRGIPIITFNNDEDCRRLCFVGQDLYRSGCVAGSLMSMMAPPGAKIAIMTPLKHGMTSLLRRLEGFQETLWAKRKDIKIVSLQNSEENAELAIQLTRDLLRKQHIDAVYVPNIFVEYIADVVEQFDLGGKIVVIGHDLSNRIKQHLQNGTINATIGQDPEWQGRKTIELLSNYLVFGEKPSQSNYYSRMEIFIKENLMD